MSVCDKSTTANNPTHQLVMLPLKKVKRIMLIVSRVIIVVTTLTSAIAIPIMSYELYARGHEPLIIAWYSAGAFVLLACLISIRGIVQHLTHYDQPNLQRFIVRILWMVPIYAVESWFCLRYKDFHVYLQIAREAYESFVIYSFMYFLFAYLGDEEKLILKLGRKIPGKIHHFFPLNYCLRPWKMGREVLHNCKWGTLQYVIAMNFCSILVWFMEERDIYQEGKFIFSAGYLYVTVIKNTSQCWAFYCLVLFYYATREELAAVHPLGKFMCVKAIVFFSFWQSVFIAILVHQGYISSHHDWTIENVATGLQDFLICVEMFVAAVAHQYVFPYTEFVIDNRNREPFIKSLLHSSLPTDIYHEMQVLKRTSICEETNPTVPVLQFKVPVGDEFLETRDSEEQSRLI